MKTYISMLMTMLALFVVLACGGSGAGELLDDIKNVASVATDSNVWTELRASDSPGARECHSAIGIGSNMYVFGGTSDITSVMNDLWVLDTTSDDGSWKALSPSGGAPLARYCHSAVTIGSVMYMFGGYDGVNSLNDIWRFDPQYSDNGLWTEMNPALDLPLARYGHTAVMLNTNSSEKMYIFGGYDGNSYMNDVWEYDPASGEGAWTKKVPTGTYPAVRYRHTAVSINSKMYVFGGYNSASGALSDLWEYDPSSGTDGHWSLRAPGGEQPQRRYNHSAAVDSKGKMYVFGGFDGTVALDELYSYDPEEGEHGTWTKLEPSAIEGLPPSWHNHSATFISGRMYVYGGRTDSYTSDLWGYTPEK